MENSIQMKEMIDTLKKNGESTREMVDLQKAQFQCLAELNGTIKQINSNLEAFLKISLMKKDETPIPMQVNGSSLTLPKLEFPAFNGEAPTRVQFNGSSLIQPKLEFPGFKGEDPWGWVTKANQFFELNPMTEIAKMNLARSHMYGPADVWFNEFVDVCELNWKSFCKKLVRRFRKSVPRYLGEVDGRKLSVHFVIGSTHSFINAATAKELKCYLEDVKPPGLVNFIAGRGTSVNKKCSNFVWSMSGHEFKAAELLIMPLYHCDIILGTNWVSKQIMSFSSNGIEIRKGKKTVLLEEFEEEAGFVDRHECFSMNVSFPSQRR